MKILVVGAGAQGAPCASMLSRDPEVSEIVLADVNKELLRKVSSKISSSKITTMRVDAGNIDDLLKAAKGVDAIVNLTLARFNLNIMEAAYKSGAHYVDTATEETIWKQIMGNEPIIFNEEFKDAGLTAVIGCGGTPGLTNVLIRYACDKLDSVHKVKTVLGGKPVQESEEVVRAWDPGWSPDVALDDWAEEPIVFEDGRFKKYPIFSGIEEYGFPDPVGPMLVSWHIHAEAITIPRFIGKGIKHAEFKYPVDKIAGALVKLGFASYDPIETKGVKVAPRDVLLSLVRQPVNSFLTEDENTVRAPSGRRGYIVIEVDGEQAGEKTKITLTRGPSGPTLNEKLEMFRRLGTTRIGVAAPAVTGVKMSMEGEAEKGVIAPECLPPHQIPNKAG